MKKTFVVLLISLMLFSLSSCGNNTYEKGYSDGYEDGYIAGSAGESLEALIGGYTSGKEEGIESALDYIEDALYDELRDIAGATARKYGLHPDEAAVVLDDFMNGKSVSKEELQTAIDSICGYYYDSFELPKKVKDMSSYID